MRRSTRPALVPALVAVLAVPLVLAGTSPATAAGPAYLSRALPMLTTPGFAANFSHIGERFSSAAIADIDGNGVPDIVAGFPNGHVYAWRTDNGDRWFDKDTGPGAVHASPVLVDYDRNGVKDVVYANSNGDVGVVTASGRMLFAAKIGRGEVNKGVFGTPGVADLDGDGNLDVVVSGFDQYLHAWGPGIFPAERRGFPIALQDTSWSSPAVGDIDGDGRPEIVVGWDCDGAPGQACAPAYGGWVGAFNSDGTRVPGWPRFIPGQVTWSSPALADLDGDGRLDVVVGTGNMGATMWDGGRQPMRGTQVFAFHGNGSTLAGWPVTPGRNVTSSPAVGDVTGDGRPEVAYVAEDGLLYVHAADGRLLWKRCGGNDVGLRPNDGSVTYGSECPVLHASPSIADVRGDGRQEVLLGGEQWMHVFDGATGEVVAQGETVVGALPMTSTPAVAQIDGQAWVVNVSGVGNSGSIFAWRTGRALGEATWPGFKAGNARTSTLAVRLQVLGSIADRWNDTGAADGPLGRPTSNEFSVAGGRGQHFERGDVYWSPSTGAHEVYGAILGRYDAMGGPDGPLGLPVTGEQGVASGRVSSFQTGAVYWSGGTGAWSVRGLIAQRYTALGGPSGPLGFPVRDEVATPGGRVSDFDHGSVFWSPATGARSVHGAILEKFLRLGGTGGLLGFPTTDERVVTGGRGGSFTGGQVLWSAGTGAHEVHGLILKTWLSRGGAGSSLRLPTTDEYAVPGGSASAFQGGVLRYDAARGTVIG